MTKSCTKLESALRQIAQNENLKSPKYEIDESPTHGYIANVNRITLADSDGGKLLHLFAKEKPDEMHAQSQWDFFYKNEATFYRDVVPAFCKVSTPALDVPLMPKCYFVSDELIVLEDLLASGYKVWQPLSKCLDLQHVEAVLEAYGKFHAFSFALRHHNPEKFNSIGPKYEWLLTRHADLTDNGYFKSLTEKLADCFDEETEFQYIETVANFLSNGQKEYFARMMDCNENDVYIHADSWTHNFMFRYAAQDGNAEKPIKPKDVCILDFQIFRRSKLVVDLAYFLSACACTEEIFNSMDDYLKVYHQSLQKHLKELNCPTSVYTWETLQYEWRKFSLKGFMMCAMVLRMMVADNDELEDRQHIAIPMQFDFVSRNEAVYQERMRIVIKYFHDHGMFDA